MPSFPGQPYPGGQHPGQPYPGAPYPQQPYPGQPYQQGTPSHPAARGQQPGGPGGPRRRWWIVPLAVIGAVVMVFGSIIVVVAVSNSSSQQTEAGPTSQPQTAQQMPSEIYTRALFPKLTGYLQAKNEAGFLSLAAPAARPAIRVWWANQEAMGFTGGTVVPAEDSLVPVNSAGDGNLTVLAGTRNSFDPAGTDGKPKVPSEAYRLGLHFSGPNATGEITSWTPLSNAPWDQGRTLYVRKAAHVEVIGDQGDSTYVNQTLPLAETAAEYDLAFVRRLNPDYVHQNGFVVFVSGNNSVRDRWFNGGGPQPRGWLGDNFAGLTFPLPGPAAGYPSDVPSSLSKDDTGGARITLTPYQHFPGETPHDQTGILVHEMIHDLLMPTQPGFYDGSAQEVSAWANEGIARAVQDLYMANPDPRPSTYDFGVATRQLMALPGSFRTGALPSDRQLYNGSSQQGDAWYTVAASVYEYIALKYGVGQMYSSADLLASMDFTPFGDVVQSQSHGSLNFYSASTVKSGWKAWLQNPTQNP